MARDFEDHCWKDVVDADTIAIYQAYRRQTYVGDNPAVLVRRAGAHPVPRATSSRQGQRRPVVRRSAVPPSRSVEDPLCLEAVS